MENKQKTDVSETMLPGHRQYLLLALPLIIGGISTPILGAVDTAVVGRMPEPSYIGGVAVGAVIMNTIYWLFGYLRMSTTGFTAQARGSNNEQEIALSFFRPMVIALSVGLLLIALQYPILQTAMYAIGASEAVTAHASTYFSIRIWGAPLTLVSYVMLGWLIGLGLVKSSLAVQLMMNLLNICLDIVFVLGLSWGVAGVAYATLISEFAAVLLGAWMLYRTKRIPFLFIRFGTMMEPSILMKMMKNNRDLLLRSVCLLTMTGVFTSIGAGFGEVTLAANAILLQIHYMMAYLLSGLANASSMLVGKAIGEKNQALYHQSFRLSAIWGAAAASLLSLSILFWGDGIVSLFTTMETVQETATALLIWMIVYPIVGFWAMQLEGIFFGATEAASIRNAIFFSLLLFFLALFAFLPNYGNTGLWIAFTLFAFGRSVLLFMYVPALTKKKFNAPLSEARMERQA